MQLQSLKNFLVSSITKSTSGYDTWFTAGGAIRIGHYDVIQDGNCKKMDGENFSIGALYNITKNQDNPIKTV